MHQYKSPSLPLSSLLPLICVQLYLSTCNKDQGSLLLVVLNDAAVFSTTVLALLIAGDLPCWCQRSLLQGLGALSQAQVALLSHWLACNVVKRFWLSPCTKESTSVLLTSLALGIYAQVGKGS